MYKFFISFSKDITPTIDFINYTIEAVKTIDSDSDQFNLISKSLLLIKDTANDEIILKGNENKVIREIWQKKEEEIIVSLDMIRGEKVFTNTDQYDIIEDFLMNRLDLKRPIRYLNLLTIKFGPNYSQRNVLAIIYIKSNEVNYKAIYHLINQIENQSLDDFDEVEIIILLKIVFNYIRILYHRPNDSYFLKAKDLFLKIFNYGSETKDTLLELFELDELDNSFFENIFNLENKSFNHKEEEFSSNKKNKTPKMLNEHRMKTYEQMNFNEQMNYRNIDVKQDDSFNELDDNVNNIQDELITEQSLEYYISKMLTFKIDQFQEASNYFMELINANIVSYHSFLLKNANEIIEVFIQVCSKIFEGGIYYEISIESYNIIFVPLQGFFQVDDFIFSLNQEIMEQLIELILTRLVLSNDEKNDIQKNDPDAFKIELTTFMVKYWNSLMIKLIERSDPNLLLTALIQIVIDFIDHSDQNLALNIHNIVFKCIIRFTRNIREFIDRIDPKVVFTVITNYFEAYGFTDSNGKKSLTALLNEIVSLMDNDYINECYYSTFGDEGDYIIRSILNDEELEEENMVEKIDYHLRQVISSINLETTRKNLSQYIDPLADILEQDKSIKFDDYANLFKNKRYFEYFSIELSKKNSTHNETKATSKLKQYKTISNSKNR